MLITKPAVQRRQSRRFYTRLCGVFDLHRPRHSHHLATGSRA